jgi:hypothetical protein
LVVEDVDSETIADVVVSLIIPLGWVGNSVGGTVGPLGVNSVTGEEVAASLLVVATVVTAACELEAGGEEVTGPDPPDPEINISLHDLEALNLSGCYTCS